MRSAVADAAATAPFQPARLTIWCHTPLMPYHSHFFFCLLRCAFDIHLYVDYAITTISAFADAYITCRHFHAYFFLPIIFLLCRDAAWYFRLLIDCHCCRFLRTGVLLCCHISLRFRCLIRFLIFCCLMRLSHYAADAIAFWYLYSYAAAFSTRAIYAAQRRVCWYDMRARMLMALLMSVSYALFIYFHFLIIDYAIWWFHKIDFFRHCCHYLYFCFSLITPAAMPFSLSLDFCRFHDIYYFMLIFRCHYCCCALPLLPPALIAGADYFRRLHDAITLLPPMPLIILMPFAALMLPAADYFYAYYFMLISYCRCLRFSLSISRYIFRCFDATLFSSSDCFSLSPEAPCAIFMRFFALCCAMRWCATCCALTAIYWYYADCWYFHWCHDAAIADYFIYRHTLIIFWCWLIADADAAIADYWWWLPMPSPLRHALLFFLFFAFASLLLLFIIDFATLSLLSDFRFRFSCRFLYFFSLPFLMLMPYYFWCAFTLSFDFDAFIFFHFISPVRWCCAAANMLRCALRDIIICLRARCFRYFERHAMPLLPLFRCARYCCLFISDYCCLPWHYASPFSPLIRFSLISLIFLIFHDADALISLMLMMPRLFRWYFSHCCCRFIFADDAAAADYFLIISFHFLLPYTLMPLRWLMLIDDFLPCHSLFTLMILIIAMPMRDYFAIFAMLMIFAVSITLMMPCHFRHWYFQLIFAWCCCWLLPMLAWFSSFSRFSAASLLPPVMFSFFRFLYAFAFFLMSHYFFYAATLSLYHERHTTRIRHFAFAAIITLLLLLILHAMFTCCLIDTPLLIFFSTPLMLIIAFLWCLFAE